MTPATSMRHENATLNSGVVVGNAYDLRGRAAVILFLNGHDLSSFDIVLCLSSDPPPWWDNYKPFR